MTAKNRTGELGEEIQEQLQGWLADALKFLGGEPARDITYWKDQILKACKEREMKTKEEIKNRIKYSRELIELTQRLPLGKGYIDAVRLQIRTLRWVLGHKLPQQYWCIQCGRRHNNVRCPKCKGDIVHPVIEEYLLNKNWKRVINK